MADQPPTKFGRTPWDLLLALSGNRSFLLWTWALAWALLAAIVFAWYYDALPKRPGTTSAQSQDGSPYMHWWFDPSMATIEQCTSASLKIHTNAGAKPIESPDADQQTTGTTGVYGSIVSVIGCAKTTNETLSFVFVAGPDQSEAKNRAALLRSLLTAELRAAR